MSLVGFLLVLVQGFYCFSGLLVPIHFSKIPSRFNRIPVNCNPGSL